MDVGSTNGWRLDDIVSPREIVATIDAEMPLEPVDPNYRGQVANRYRYKDGGCEIGVIASVTQALLRELHACAHIGRGQAIHVPVRNQGSRPA